MNVLLKAVCAATLVAATVLATGCGETFRQVATPQPVPAGNPAGSQTEVVLNQCPTGAVCTDISGTPTGSTVTAIDVAGDVNMGNKPLQNRVGNVADPLTGTIVQTPMEFDAARTSLFTANTSTDTVTQLSLSASTAGFAANTSTLTLPAGSAPVAISFQYAGLPYTQDYVVNSGTTTVDCPGTGSLGVIDQTTSPATLKTTVCLPPIGAGPPNPVAAWIYTPDRSKVFVLDNQPGAANGNVYVVNAANAQVTNHFAVGNHPFKVAQSNDGLFLYVVNSGADTGVHTISIINTQTESVVGTVSTDLGSVAVPVDVAQITNFNDTSANTQVNHVWILHADGVVSVFDGTKVSQTNTLAPITSVATGGTPTNLALLRDGTWAYVGLAGTNRVVGIDTSNFSTTPITIPGRHVENNQKNTLEETTRTVTSVAVSRQGNSAQLSKLYVTTVTSTTFNYYDPTGLVLQDSKNFDNLFNGTAIISAADIPQGAPELHIPINQLITILPAPAQVVTCNPGNAPPVYDAQKNCPAMQPVLALGGS